MRVRAWASYGNELFQEKKEHPEKCSPEKQHKFSAATTRTNPPRRKDAAGEEKFWSFAQWRAFLQRSDGTSNRLETLINYIFAMFLKTNSILHLHFTYFARNIFFS